jgi:transcriptional regulator with PAS, ATPase and Fis domain
MSGAQPPITGKGRPRGSSGFGWRAFFQHSQTPVFVVGKGRRLRFANTAWEKLTGVPLSEALGMACSARRAGSALQATLAPTPEAMAGRADRARRPAPPAKNGPPWWDITFVPLAGESGIFGVVGFIQVFGEPVPAAAKRVPASVAELRAARAAHFSFDLLESPALATAHFVSQARLAAQVYAPLWLVGERGSGKETAARAIHHSGPNRERAFVSVDCAGLQPYLIESALFGLGGVAASERVGTLYLKEPTALPRDLQQKLADHVAEHPQLRLACGSEHTAAHAVSTGALVPVFQTALSALELRVPPLRDRLDDLPRLAARMVPNRALDSAALVVLQAHTWPGNLRELADVLRDAAARAPDGPILREHLPLVMRVKADAPRAAPAKPLELDAILEAVEKRLIALALAKCNQNQTDAAALLGVFRTRLSRRIEALGLQQKKPEGGAP